MGNLVHCGGIQTGAATVENSMEFPQNTKNGTASAKPLLELCPKNPETPIHMNLCTRMFIAAQLQWPSAVAT